MSSHQSSLVGIAPGALHTLRTSLERVVGDQSAAMLQEAGFSSGEDVYADFAMWLEAELGVTEPQEVDAEHLSDLLSRFFSSSGWGRVSLERLGSSAMVLSAPAWAESTADGNGDLPSCHLTTGMLAAMLGRLADDVVAVMEVDCRSRGDKECRFLIGAPETLQAVFEGMSEGSDYEELLTAAR